MPEPKQTVAPAASSAPAATPAPRNTVEMIEGAKKRSVDFP
jgi:hypothetical protein